MYNGKNLQIWLLRGCNMLTLWVRELRCCCDYCKPPSAASIMHQDAYIVCEWFIHFQKKGGYNVNNDLTFIHLHIHNLLFYLKKKINLTVYFLGIVIIFISIGFNSFFVHMKDLNFQIQTNKTYFIFVASFTEILPKSNITHELKF